MGWKPLVGNRTRLCPFDSLTLETLMWSPINRGTSGPSKGPPQRVIDRLAEYGLRPPGQGSSSA